MDNVKDFFSYNVPALISAFAIAAAPSVSGTVVYAATVVGDNISTSGTLEVSGNSIFMANVGIGTSAPNLSGFSANNTVLSIEGKATDTSGIIELIATDLTAENRLGGISFINKDGGGSLVSQAQIRGIRDGDDTATALTFYTEKVGLGAAEAMRIDNAGNVGIGTAAPLAQLDVKETVRISRVTSGNNMDLDFYNPIGTGAQVDVVAKIRGDGDGVSNYYGALSFWTARLGSRALTEGMRLTSAGNVGIGTTNPVAKLHVSDVTNTTARLTVASDFQALGSIPGELYFTKRNGKGYADYGSGIRGYVDSYADARNNGLQLFTSSHSEKNEARVTILTGGNVGIGTTSPGAKLEVAGVVRFSGISAANELGPDSVWGNNLYFSSGWKYRANGEGVKYGEVTGGNFDVSTAPSGTAGNSATLTNRLTVTNTGNVGIGTTNPTQKLDVLGIVRANNNDTFGDPTGSLGDGARFSLNDVTNPYAIGVGGIDGTKHPMWFQTGDINGGGFEWYIGTNEKMRIDKDGNVGIGTTSPGSALSVVGLPSGTTDSVVGGDLAGAVCITDTGNMYIDTDGSCAN